MTLFMGQDTRRALRRIDHPVIVHDAANRRAGGYFCTVNGTENSVFSQTMLKTPPLEGSLETAIVN
jgi:hypothetical protein